MVSLPEKKVAPYLRRKGVKEKRRGADPTAGLPLKILGGEARGNWRERKRGVKEGTRE